MKSVLAKLNGQVRIKQKEYLIYTWIKPNFGQEKTDLKQLFL